LGSKEQLPVKTRSPDRRRKATQRQQQQTGEDLCRTIHSKSGEHFDAVVFSQFFLSLVNVVQQVGFNHCGFNVSFNAPHNFHSNNIVVLLIMTFKYFPECAFP
jgi:hypothetical protein